MNDSFFPYKARRVLGMTTTEAGQLVHVTRRTWEMWESGTTVMPLAKRELFAAKLQGEKSEGSMLFVVIADNGNTPIDVVSSDNFCSLMEKGDGSFVISSLAIRREDGSPYVHRQTFRAEHNTHVIKAVKKMKSVLDE